MENTDFVVKHSIIKTLKNKKGKTTNLSIIFRVSFLNKRAELYSGYTIDLEKWCSKTKKVRQGYTNNQNLTYSEINRGLNTMENYISMYLNKCATSNKLPSHEELKRLFDNEYSISGGKTFDFFYYLKEFVDERSKLNHWSDDTFEKYQVVKNHLEFFDKKITFEKLNHSGLISYMNYLLTRMYNDSVKKQLDFLKTFLKWAYDKEYNKCGDFLNFKPKLKTAKKKIIFLCWEELKQVMKYDIPKNKSYLERVRDCFVFSCFTSLRYSDMFALKRSNVKDDYIELTTEKDDDFIKINLNKYSRAILCKYKDIPYKDNKALPVISNQTMNFYLKELMELSGIDEDIVITKYKGEQRFDETHKKFTLIGTHCGRRSFISISLILGIPSHVVMRWTGHSDYKAMLPYIEVADKSKEEQMAKFDELE